MRRRGLLIFLWFCAGASTEAHPVAQGSLDFDLRDDHVSVRARVSNEEVFVACTFEQFNPPAADVGALFRHHGEYLLRHVSVRAGDRPLQGVVETVEIPEDRTTNGFVRYELRYDFAGARPSELTVSHDVLQEVDFGGGNRWSASFVVSQKRNGQMIGQAALLESGNPLTLKFNAGEERPGLFGSYLRHGVVHILEGWDHLLFIAALVLGVSSLWELIKVVTAFTLAHTITLALSVFDLVRLSSSIVEPMIALSIIVVAVQNVVRPQSARGKGRLLTAFGFGLFHGFGFAGGLVEAMQGMGTGTTILALVGFSLGVELGHQVIVVPLFLLMLVYRRRTAVERAGGLSTAVRWASTTIALAGCAYFVAAVRG